MSRYKRYHSFVSLSFWSWLSKLSYLLFHFEEIIHHLQYERERYTVYMRSFLQTELNDDCHLYPHGNWPTSELTTMLVSSNLSCDFRNPYWTVYFRYHMIPKINCSITVTYLKHRNIDLTLISVSSFSPPRKLIFYQVVKMNCSHHSIDQILVT